LASRSIVLKQGHPSIVLGQTAALPNRQLSPQQLRLRQGAKAQVYLREKVAPTSAIGLWSIHCLNTRSCIPLPTIVN